MINLSRVKDNSIRNNQFRGKWFRNSEHFFWWYISNSRLNYKKQIGGI